MRLQQAPCTKNINYSVISRFREMPEIINGTTVLKAAFIID